MGILDFILGLFRRGRREQYVPEVKALGMDALAFALDMEEDSLLEFKPRYNRFFIPKRSGGRREIAAPDKATKELQKKLLDKLFKRLPVSEHATGFRKRHSIVNNAIPHVRKDVIIKIDLQNFFPSIKSDKLFDFCRSLGWNREASDVLVRICTLDGGLPQGAVTSPALSNLLNRKLDARLAGMAAHYKADYTRYADDITFSFNQSGTRPVSAPDHGTGEWTNFESVIKKKKRGCLAREIVRFATGIIHEEGYRVNRKKLRIIRRHQRQSVTGLVVNDGVGVPREMRRKLRAVRHSLQTKGQATMTEEQLRGWESYLLMIDSMR